MDTIPSVKQLTAAFDFMKGVAIPKVPGVVLELQQEATDPEPDLNLIAEIIERDIALSGLVLKSINSASYGLSRRIESITQATILLGLNTIKEVVLYSALRQALGESTPFQQKIWQGAQSCALGAKALALSVEGVSAETAYLAGLFHDVGALVMGTRQPEYEQMYMHGLTYPISVLEKETAEYGTNHTVIGYLLAQHWQLPDSVCIAIYNSHEVSCASIVDSDIRALISMIKLTQNAASHLLFPQFEFSGEASRSLAGAYMELTVDTDSLQEMQTELRKANK